MLKFKPLKPPDINPLMKESVVRDQGRSSRMKPAQLCTTFSVIGCSLCLQWQTERKDRDLSLTDTSLNSTFTAPSNLHTHCSLFPCITSSLSLSSSVHSLFHWIRIITETLTQTATYSRYSLVWRTSAHIQFLSHVRILLLYTTMKTEGRSGS